MCNRRVCFKNVNVQPLEETAIIRYSFVHLTDSIWIDLFFFFRVALFFFRRGCFVLWLIVALFECHVILFFIVHYSLVTSCARELYMAVLAIGLPRRTAFNQGHSINIRSLFISSIFLGLLIHSHLSLVISCGEGAPMCTVLFCVRLERGVCLTFGNLSTAFRISVTDFSDEYSHCTSYLIRKKKKEQQMKIGEKHIDEK